MKDKIRYYIAAAIWNWQNRWMWEKPRYTIRDKLSAYDRAMKRWNYIREHEGVCEEAGEKEK